MMTEKEKQFLLDFGTEPVLRKLMSSDEIKMANKLYKKGFLEKGTSDDGKSSVIFYVDSYIYNKL